jgi:hypothetical protein
MPRGVERHWLEALIGVSAIVIPVKWLDELPGHLMVGVRG